MDTYSLKNSFFMKGFSHDLPYQKTELFFLR